MGKYIKNKVKGFNSEQVNKSNSDIDINLHRNIKYVLYARKSTESDEKQALSIDSQIKEMQEIAERDNLNVVEIRRESHSAKDSGKRPVYLEILEDIRRGRFNAILTWAPDRLSRNAGDLGKLVDLMDQNILHEIRTYGQMFKNSPNEKFLLMILCSQAKLENDNRGINVKRGHKTRCEMGLWPAMAPTGYVKEKRTDRKCMSLIDPERGPVIKQMFEKVAYEKWSGRKVYNWLRFDLNFRTEAGKKHLSLGNIFRLFSTTFYYGEFEWPRGSGRWYVGKHEPLITKDLFDKVQDQVKMNFLVPRATNKEFAFTKILTCGLCGSAISADEKFKKLKDGSSNRHVYYFCTKSQNQKCTLGYINEINLIKNLQSLIDKIDFNKIALQNKIKEELDRFKKFQSILLNRTDNTNFKEIDVREYVKWVLKGGTIEEKRELISSFKGSLKLYKGELKIV